jgi:hypothetical protein
LDDCNVPDRRLHCDSKDTDEEEVPNREEMDVDVRAPCRLLGPVQALLRLKFRLQYHSRLILLLSHHWVFGPLIQCSREGPPSGCCHCQTGGWMVST